MAIVNLNSEDDFQKEVLDNDGLTLVDFWAEWCGPCRMLGKTLEAISNDKEDLKIVKVNVDSMPNLAAKFRVQNIPFVILFKGGDVVDQAIGNQPKAKYMDMLANHA